MHTANTHKLSLPDTGERFLPGMVGGIELEHWHRYFFALEFVKNKVVLDIACGEGYGANFLAEQANSVYGVDIAPEVIHYAQQKYPNCKVEFKVGSCANIPLPDHCVDVVVSFETIEHHTEHEAMMREIVRVLRPDGLLILSSPDKHQHTDVMLQNNPYHPKELYRSELESLLSVHFKHYHMMGQQLTYGSHIVSLQENATGNFLTYSGGLDTLNKKQGLQSPVYFMIMASQVALPQLHHSFYENKLQMRELIGRLDSNEKIIQTKEMKIADLLTQLQEKEKHINHINQDLDGKILHINNQNTVFQEKENYIAQQDSFLQEKDHYIAKQSDLLQEKDQHINKQENLLQEKDQYINKQENILQEKDHYIAYLLALLRDKEQEMDYLTAVLQVKQQSTTHEI